MEEENGLFRKFYSVPFRCARYKLVPTANNRIRSSKLYIVLGIVSTVHMLAFLFIVYLNALIYFSSSVFLFVFLLLLFFADNQGLIYLFI